MHAVREGCGSLLWTSRLTITTFPAIPAIPAVVTIAIVIIDQKEHLCSMRNIIEITQVLYIFCIWIAWAHTLAFTEYWTISWNAFWFSFRTIIVCSIPKGEWRRILSLLNSLTRFLIQEVRECRHQAQWSSYVTRLIVPGVFKAEKHWWWRGITWQHFTYSLGLCHAPGSALYMIKLLNKGSSCAGAPEQMALVQSGELFYTW